MKVKSYMLSVVLFLSIVSLVGCDGGGSNSTGPSSSIVGTWEGYSPGLGINVKVVFMADGKYEEYRQNMSCPFKGTYVDYGGKVVVTKTGGFCGVFREPLVLTWTYRIEGDKLWLWDAEFKRI